MFIYERNSNAATAKKTRVNKDMPSLFNTKIIVNKDMPSLFNIQIIVF